MKELEEVMKGKANTYYEMFIHLNRGILFFKTGKYNDAIRSFVKYYTNEYYKKSDNLFKFRVAITELMMHFESKDLAGISIRLEQVRKQFKDEMEQIDACAEKLMYNWMQLLRKQELKYSNEKVLAALRVLVKDKRLKQNEDSQLLNYHNWLQSKLAS